jgi:hypothetical protein
MFGHTWPKTIAIADLPGSAPAISAANRSVSVCVEQLKTACILTRDAHLPTLMGV